MESMRRGEPVHFGMACARCAETPLVGDCYKCTTCDCYLLCGECYASREESDHPEGHSFVMFGEGGPTNAHDVPPGPGGLLTVLVRPPQRNAVAGSGNEDEPSEETSQQPMQGDAAMTAAEVAFAAVRSLALAPLDSSALPESGANATPAAGDAGGAGSSSGSGRVQQSRPRGR